MEIRDLKDGLKISELPAIITQVDPIKVFKKQNGTEGRYQTFTVEDDTGKIEVAFFNEQIDRYSTKLEPGKKIRFKYCIAKQFHERLQIRTGKIEQYDKIYFDEEKTDG